ncbi:hypothetical protein [Tenacibaculum xiamenense]|uniref:hypothetical protein n=1 Tax=Tenacibaculum xiamenense TaxID=1261553 RepID=UPI0038B646B3
MKNILKNFKALSKEELRSINAGSDECERHAHRLNMPPYRRMGGYNDPCFWMLIRIAQAQRDN